MDSVASHALTTESDGKFPLIGVMAFYIGSKTELELCALRSYPLWLYPLIHKCIIFICHVYTPQITVNFFYQVPLYSFFPQT